MMKHAEPLIDFLAAHGYRSHVEHKGRGHPRLIIEVGETTRFYVIPGSPSDWRSGEKAKTDLRRMLGIATPKRREKKPRKRRPSAAPRPVECPGITAGRDWAAPLADLRRRMEPWPDVDGARAAYRRAPRGQRLTALRHMKQAVTDALRRHNEQSR